MGGENKVYSEKFGNAVNLLGELGNLEELQKALQKDHVSWRRKLVGKVNSIMAMKEMVKYNLPTHGGDAKKGKEADKKKGDKDGDKKEEKKDDKKDDKKEETKDDK